MKYRIYHAERTYCSPNWRWRNDGTRHTELNIWLVIEGRAWMERRGKRIRIRAGDFFLHRHRIPHVAWADAAEPPVVFWCVFHVLTEQNEPIEVPEDALPQWHRRVRNVQFSMELMKRLAECFRSTSPLTDLWVDACLSELRRLDAFPLQSEQAGRLDTRMGTLCQRLERNPLATIRVEVLAEEMGYSRDHFIRLFKQYKGVTPGEFLIQCRMQHARQMLSFTETSISGIAETLAYGDVYAFSKQFRRRTGKTPSAFRRNAQATR